MKHSATKESMAPHTLPAPRPAMRAQAQARRSPSARPSRGPRSRTKGGRSRKAGAQPAAEWASASASCDCNASVATCWDLWYNQRQRFPEWMSWLDRVVVKADGSSEWTLRQEFLGQEYEFSWKSVDEDPVYKPIRKMAWRSVSGLSNAGSVRFFSRQKGGACRVQLSISYEVPGVLLPAADALKPFVEQRLAEDMRSFAQLVEQESP